jgi:hypothetical protein
MIELVLTTRPEAGSSMWRRIARAEQNAPERLTSRSNPAAINAVQEISDDVNAFGPST